MAAKCAVCGKSETKLMKCGRCHDRAYCGTQCQKKDWPTHKTECKSQNYVLKIDLFPRFINNPRITRTLSCPATATFVSLHKALIVAFGWANTHLYDFEVFNHSNMMGRENRLAGGEPMFKISESAEEEFSMPFMKPPPRRDSARVTLSQIMDDPKTKGKAIHYLYDFGDGWEHVISCTGRAAVTPNFVCIEGEGHGCAEDVGGWSGWNGLLEAYDAQNPTQDQKDLMLWFETQCSNKDTAGLCGENRLKWDKDAINKALSEIGKPAPSASKSPKSVLLISLEKQPFFEQMYGTDCNLLPKLHSRAAVTEVTTLPGANQELASPKDAYAAIVVTDASVMEKEFLNIQKKLVEYAKSGGTVIFGFHFPSFAEPPKFDSFLKTRWGLNWEFGDYQRETFLLNSNPVARTNPMLMGDRPKTLWPEYSMKAVHLKGTQPEDRVYLESPNSAQSPAVFAKYGNGFVGFIGDVNTEDGTTELLLAMCGV